jgi:hypothetical protein
VKRDPVAPATLDVCVDVSNVDLGVLSAQQIVQADKLRCTIDQQSQIDQLPAAMQRAALA